ncbi:hypothetical protein HJC23_011642 [Cyclotella cryptica]|uniref:EGF-like domain-containing protein n=2 Tax=Cyclotella cryptica TaxID=29204 RepID=A0ABD3QRL1_9STRA
MNRMPSPLAQPTISGLRRVLEDEACGGCNNGTCVVPIDTTGALSGKRPSCQCKNTGFVGDHCEIPCSKKCLNGGKCVPAQEDSGVEETCSCTKAVVDGNPFAGLTCEYGATKSCMTLGSDSKHSFCTNGGECQDIVGDNELHKDCICPDGFEGPHCEYISGTKPSFLTSNSNGANYSSESPLSNSILYALMAGVCILIGFILLSFFVRARRRRAEAVKKERELQRATEELAMVQLDLDDDDDHGYGARPAFI